MPVRRRCSACGAPHVRRLPIRHVAPLRCFLDSSMAPTTDAQDSSRAFLRAMTTEPTRIPRAAPSETPSPLPRATLLETTPTRRPNIAPNTIQTPRFPQIPRPSEPGGVSLLVIASLPRARAVRLTIWRPTTADAQPTSSTTYHLTSRFPAADRDISAPQHFWAASAVTYCKESRLPPDTRLCSENRPR